MEKAWYEERPRRPFEPGDILRHFKRDFESNEGTNFLYEYIGVAVHTETGAEFAVYRALYGAKHLYIRPADMFFSRVNAYKHPEAIQRFRFEHARPEDLAAVVATKAPEGTC